MTTTPSPSPSSPPASATIEVKELSKHYHKAQEKIEILKGLNLKVEQGESVAILGKSGSGKSTLLSLLCGLDRADSGSIQIANFHFDQMGEKELTYFRAQTIGIVFQQFHLLPHLSALENVSLPLELKKDPEAKAKAQKALESLGLGERKHHLPGQLSGGECQRVALARAFVVKPRLLLADEPTGNLDEQTGQEIIDLLFQLAQENGMTLVVVTHSEELARRCQKKYYLHGGRLHESL